MTTPRTTTPIAAPHAPQDRAGRMARAATAILLGALVFAPAHGADEPGFYIETMNRTTGMMGQGAESSMTKTYVTADRMRVVNDGPEGSEMLLDPRAGTMTLLDHDARAYLRIDLNAMRESLSGDALERMRAMMGETAIQVEETGETKRIGEWNTRGYRVTKTGMMRIEQEIWATEDVDLDVGAFTDMMDPNGPGGMLTSPAERDAQRAEMRKIKGYPILTKTRMDMMGNRMEAETEVTLIRPQAMPPEIFAIPAGYSERGMEMGLPGLPGARP